MDCANEENAAGENMSITKRRRGGSGHAIFSEIREINYDTIVEQSRKKLKQWIPYLRSCKSFSEIRTRKGLTNGEENQNNPAISHPLDTGRASHR